jgi:CBS-domain-containing membrane protein
MIDSIDRFLATSVGDIMSHDVISVRDDETMTSAAGVLTNNRISGVPVVDQFDHCVGVLSSADYKRYCQQDSDSAEPGELSRHAVAEFMTSPAITLSPQASLMDAGFLMCNRHIHRLPVADEAGLLVGMLSALDVVASMVHQASVELTGQG